MHNMRFKIIFLSAILKRGITDLVRDFDYIPFSKLKFLTKIVCLMSIFIFMDLRKLNYHSFLVQNNIQKTEPSLTKPIQSSKFINLILKYVHEFLYKVKASHFFLHAFIFGSFY